MTTERCNDPGLYRWFEAATVKLRLCLAVRRPVDDNIRRGKVMRVFAELRSVICWGFVLALYSSFLPAPKLEAQTKGKTLVVGHGVDLESLNPYWHNTNCKLRGMASFSRAFD